MEKSNEGTVNLFKPTTQNNQPCTKEEIEQLDYDSSKAIEASQLTIKAEYIEKLNTIDLVIKSIENRINQF